MDGYQYSSEAQHWHHLQKHPFNNIGFLYPSFSPHCTCVHDLYPQIIQGCWYLKLQRARKKWSDAQCSIDIGQWQTRNYCFSLMTIFCMPYMEALIWNYFWDFAMRHTNAEELCKAIKDLWENYSQVLLCLNVWFAHVWERRHLKLCAGGNGWRSDARVWEHPASSSSSCFPSPSSHCWEDWRAT